MAGELAYDITTELRKRLRAAPPPGGEVGRYLVKVSGKDYDFAWGEGPAREILLHAGNPNTFVNGMKGQLCADIATPALYQNLNGLKGWALASGSSLPMPAYDDGTTTYLIDAGVISAGSFVFLATDDATLNDGGIAFFVNGTNAQSGQSVFVSGGASGHIDLEASTVNCSVDIDANNAAGANAQITLDTGVGTTNSSILFRSLKLGFHGVTPVVKAGTPTTVSDVITILQDLGLCS